MRDGGRRPPAQRSAEAARIRRPRSPRAVHGRVRPRAGLRRRPRSGDEGDGRGGEEDRDAGHARPCAQARHRLRRVSRQRRLQAVRRGARGQAHARRTHQDRQRRRPSRAWRRGLPDRPQVDLRARRKGPAADGGERRRGRARHVQGPLLSRPRSAPRARRHADRRLGGRGGRGLLLSPRRISGNPADAGAGDRQASSRGPRQVYENPSPPRRRRLHLRRRVGDDRVRSRASAACRGIARLTSRRSACSAGRRSSRTSRRSTGSATSSRRARSGRPRRAATSARASAASRSPAG